MIRTKMLPVAAFTGMLLISAVGVAWSQEPKFKATVPESVMTPDKVQTEFLGDLEFFDGMPSKATVKKTYDLLDFSRGVDAFLSGSQRHLFTRYSKGSGRRV